MQEDMEHIEIEEEGTEDEAPETEPSGEAPEGPGPGREAAEEGQVGDRIPLQKYNELNDKYLRLYADFENYRKRASKDREDLVMYANESILYELLTSIDHLEIALQHADNEASSGLRQGVEMTLRELMRTLEKFGLKPIEALDKPFNPEIHHAMAQVERDDVEENTVVEELRKGYTYGDKVLRASMVTVSARPSAGADEIKYPDKEETERKNISEEEQ